MKKAISLLLAILLPALCLLACSPKQPSAVSEKKIQIVTTIFPEYDWVMNVLGDNSAGAEVTLLLDSGVDLHSFQPAVEDILKISACDLFVYVGGESDGWVSDALQEATNQDMIVINLLDVLGDAVKEEEIVEGMEAEEEGEAEGAEEEPEYDEHVWLSLKNAARLVSSLREALAAIDPAHAADYERNAAAYIQKLDELDAAYRAAVAESSQKTLLFGDRFPFRYLTEDYGLSYYAAFVGCSAETEASFETIAFLSQKVDELGLHTVLTIEGADQRIARTIVENTQTKDQQILTMDSLQAITAQNVQEGTTYLSVMESNLAVLRAALG